jgi:hypothetical protein
VHVADRTTRSDSETARLSAWQLGAPRITGRLE